jgi:hypothetical protein
MLVVARTFVFAVNLAQAQLAALFNVGTHAAVAGKRCWVAAVV